MLTNLSRFKKTKLALISLAFVVSSVLCGAGASKIINLKAGQSLDIDNLKIVCEATSNTINLDIENYKKSRNLIVKFCNSFMSSATVQKCLAVNAKYVEPEALKICSSFMSAEKSIECLKTIANKIYSNEELRDANRYLSAEDTVKSLQQSGATI